MDRVLASFCFVVLVALFSVPTEVLPAAVETQRLGGTNSKTSKKGEQHPEPLIYPGEPHEDASLNRGGISSDTTPAPCPDNALFCESAPDYPKDVIKTKLKKQPKLLLDIMYEEEIGDDVHNKFGPDSDSEMELCSSTANIVYPNKARSKGGEFEFVVNDDEHKQGVRVETCTNNKGECKIIPAGLPLGYKSSCEQKYILRTLVVLNRNSSSDVQGFVTKPFEFPSCCSCVITMPAMSYRFGGEEDKTPSVNVTQQSTPKPVKHNTTKAH